MKRVKTLETDEQTKLVSWFRIQHKQLAKCLFSIPNGSVLAGDAIKRAKQMNKLKREGFVNGVSDLFLMIPNSQYHGLFIEMKRAEGGKVSEEQHQFIENAKERGYQAIVCKGFEQAKNTILEYMRG